MSTSVRIRFRRSLLRHAEPVLLVDDEQTEVGEPDLRPSNAVVPITTWTVAVRDVLQHARQIRRGA
jgi:hypothetical protein